MIAQMLILGGGVAFLTLWILLDIGDRIAQRRQPDRLPGWEGQAEPSWTTRDRLRARASRARHARRIP